MRDGLSHFSSPVVHTFICSTAHCYPVISLSLYIYKRPGVFSFVTIYRLNRSTYMDIWYVIRTGFTCRWFVMIEKFHICHNGLTRDENVSKIVKKCNYLGNYASNRNSEGILCSSTFNFVYWDTFLARFWALYGHQDVFVNFDFGEKVQQVPITVVHSTAPTIVLR